MISDAAIHEIDLVRWLFDEEVVATSILKPRRSSKGSADGHQDQSDDGRVDEDAGGQKTS